MEPNQPEYDYLVKLLILGDGKVGKTSILLRFTEDYFPNSHIQTLGIDFKLKLEKIQGKVHKFQIWDTAGQERFRKLTTAYYKNANGIILVYDVNKRDTFEMVSFWMDEIKKNGLPEVSKVLVGNQIDKNERQVSTQEGKNKAKEFGVHFFETSAKTGEGIQNLFEYIGVNARVSEEFKTGRSVKVKKEKVKKKKRC